MATSPAKRGMIAKAVEIAYTVEAARILGVSRQYFIQLLQEEQIPFHMAGTHRRVYVRDVFDKLDDQAAGIAQTKEFVVSSLKAAAPEFLQNRGGAQRISGLSYSCVG